MKPHWNEDEFAENMIDSGARAQSHLEECADCRAEVEQFDDFVRDFRDSAHDAAERPQFFWNAQQTAIRARVEARSKSYSIWWALTSAAALAALAIAMLIPGSKPQPQMHSATATQTHVDQDELLMRQVDESLMSNVAEPLEPAGLIASDLGDAMLKAQKNSKGQ